MRAGVRTDSDAWPVVDGSEQAASADGAGRLLARLSVLPALLATAWLLAGLPLLLLSSPLPLPASPRSPLPPRRLLSPSLSLSPLSQSLPLPVPFAASQGLLGFAAPTTTAMVDFVTRVVGWHATGAYHALNYEVNSAWDLNSAALRNVAVRDLREAVAADRRRKW